MQTLITSICVSNLSVKYLGINFIIFLVWKYLRVLKSLDRLKFCVQLVAYTESHKEYIFLNKLGKFGSINSHRLWSQRVTKNDLTVNKKDAVNTALLIYDLLLWQVQMLYIWQAYKPFFYVNNIFYNFIPCHRNGILKIQLPDMENYWLQKNPLILKLQLLGDIWSRWYYIQVVKMVNAHTRTNKLL